MTTVPPLHLALAPFCLAQALQLELRAHHVLAFPGDKAKGWLKSGGTLLSTHLEFPKQIPGVFFLTQGIAYSSLPLWLPWACQCLEFRETVQVKMVQEWGAT